MSEPQTETLYSPSYVAEQLGVSAPQVRRWAAALETVTGQPIRQQPRTGRAYTQRELATLLEAKRIASAASGMSAETALSIALGKTGMSVPLAKAERASELSAEVLSKALAEALAETQRPLLAELQEVNAKLQLLLEVQEQPERAEALPEELLGPEWSAEQPQATEIAEGQQEMSEKAPGVLVRAAQRLEGWVQMWLKK